MRISSFILLTDPVVHAYEKGLISARDALNALAEERAALIKRVIELEGIAPRRIKTPDGKVFIWHCPDALIPETMVTL